jgi:3-oxoacyl-[acyl-carrier protein] reductase
MVPAGPRNSGIPYPAVMDLGIAGRRAAVAAASDGLGLGAARALVLDGVDVAVCGRDPERLGRAVDELGSLGTGSVHGVVGDVSTTEGADAFVVEATDRLGGIDILVANGGGPPAGGFAGTPLGAYGPALELSLLATVAMCVTAVPPMRARGWGRVVAITSVSVRQPIPGLILSNTARAGLTGFLKTLALEVAADGVTVNSVQPGSHDTERLRSLHGGDLTAAAASVPTGVLGRPEDFGAVVAFLCSDQARFVTGAAVPVDGGAYRALQ